LILAGPKSVALFDNHLVTTPDLARNFYCKTEHIGKATRAQASL